MSSECERVFSGTAKIITLDVDVKKAEMTASVAAAEAKANAAAVADIGAIRVDSGRISRVEWTEMYIHARAKAITANSILGGWRGAGLVPLSPMTVLEKLPSRSATTDSPPHTPLEQPDLDLSLLHSSPPDGTELREANALLNSTLESTKEVPCSVQRYTERMTRFAESKHSENVTSRKQVEEQEKLLDMRKARKKGKRIALKGRFVFSTEEVLETAKEAEAKLSSKKPRGRP
ncbi:hypothetical protein B0A49_13595, partial [Cryomyces minteri]